MGDFNGDLPSNFDWNEHAEPAPEPTGTCECGELTYLDNLWCSACAPKYVRCRECGYNPQSGEDWGYLDGPRWVDTCEHVAGQRYCDSCSAYWWQVGMKPDWDVDGCKRQECPDCMVANAEAAS